MKLPQLLLVLAALLLTLSSCSEALSENRGPEAPDFALPDLNGTVHHLSDYRGEKVYLFFWASWCSICLSGLNELEELAESENDFTILTIISPGTYAERNANEFNAWFSAIDHHGDFIVLLDDGGDIFGQFEMEAYPSSAWISSAGRITKQRTGHISNDEILELMNSIR
ncbi:TlpA family protein disulfide reductase [Planococcus maritimus]|uniref:TlpA family protein disulfide reductase n=1 Tax=Planococcus maritimus TaxID=192421 RepID=UPI00232E91A4|nr:TlpA disulfide reductase family protein [Planococcus maritimus]